MEERVYDLIFICRPATPEEEIDKIITTLETFRHRTRRQDREDRKVGHAPAGLSRGQAPRGLLRLHGRCAAPTATSSRNSNAA